MYHPSMRNIWMLVGLFSIFATNVAAQSCPANFNSEAQIVLISNGTGPLSALGAPRVDTNLTYFREVLRYSDDEIQQETQKALQFFNERFGLNFSLSPPNEQGLRFFQNATFQPTRQPSGIVATFNRWSITGNTRSRCFPAAIGGYFVSFSGEQTLRGTYGGEEGVKVTNNRVLQYGYISISIPHRDPVVIQRQSPIPNEAAQLGVFVLFYELSHPTLGQGAQQGFFQTEPVNGTVLRYSGGAVLTFPPNVLSFN